MNDKIYNDAIIGNKNIVASFSTTGELLRLTYPNADYKQFIDFFHTGIKVNDSNLIYCHTDINNKYNQYYTEETNILNTEIVNTYFKLKIIQTDFIPIKQDILVKKYTFINDNTIDLNLNFLVNSKLNNISDNSIGARIYNNALMQYSHDYTLSIFSKKELLSKQLHNVNETINDGVIFGKDVIGMTENSSISFDIGVLKPNEKKTFELFVCITENKQIENLNDINTNINKIRKMNIEKELQDTKKYWQKYVVEHDTIPLDIEKTDERIENIYKRTILLYPLLTNLTTGGISAAVEMDEKRQHGGGYAFCWPRDAVFITKAMDVLGMEKETEKFYKNFCKNTQSNNGMWEQRFYTDTTLAPCWGYQIDETAGVVYGILEHYKKTNEVKFLKDTLKITEKAIKFLKDYLTDILNNENKYAPSYDLWEMKEGVHLYSLASIFGAFNAMIEIYNTLKPVYENNRLKQQNIITEIENLKKLLLQIKNYVLNNLYDDTKKSLVRNADDNMLDISIIGSVIPFKMFSAKEKTITNTVEMMNLTLRTYTGGYKRFENDHYRGGNDPWTITTLWMALYYIQLGHIEKARECFDFVTNTSTGHGFLGEQVNNETMSTSWVIGLGWAHAMYVLVLDELSKLGHV